MKSVYVIYDDLDFPFAVVDTLGEAYNVAYNYLAVRGCYVSIDRFEWQGKNKYTYRIGDRDFGFNNQRGENIPNDELSKRGIIWYNVIVAYDREELEKFKSICQNCELVYNDEVRKKFYIH